MKFLTSNKGLKVGAFTCVCEEDKIWIPQYLAECERLRIPFVLHFDNWEPPGEVLKHPCCLGVTTSSNQFSEITKQIPYTELLRHRYDWAMVWDIDETFEKNAEEKIATILDVEVGSYINIKLIHLWGDKDRIRIDPPFNNGHRDKFYKLHPHRHWSWKSKITNGPYAQFHAIEVKYHDLVCLHHGMMTHELRLQHKERWDKIYTKVGGRNPYGFWDHCLDYENYPPVTILNPY